jgi:hypothetical protein
VIRIIPCLAAILVVFLRALAHAEERHGGYRRSRKPNELLKGDRVWPARRLP